MSNAFSQVIEADMEQRTSTDMNGASILPLKKAPREKIVLPPVDTTGAFYLSIFYSWDVEGNEIVTALVLPGDKGETIFVDLNNDEDLSNDGEPIIFPHDQNEIIFYLYSESTPQQRTGRFLQRIPQFALDDSTAFNFMDASGNLKESYAKFWKTHHPGFEGAKGTYFFDGYVDLSRGHVQIGNEKYAIGLHDYNQNGRFDDVVGTRDPRSSDRLMIDLGKDGSLNPMSTTEIFKLDDVFKINGQNYKLQHVDPYGARVVLAKTNEPLTNYFVQEFEEKQEEYGFVQKGRIGENIWSMILTPLNGVPIPMRSLKGQYILLNFWGEWCAPCIEEIPALIQSRDNWTDKLTIIGMLNTYNLKEAEALIEEKSMDWPHILTNEHLVEQFKVNSYPTNILILPDGETFVQTGQMSTAFIDNQIN